jgi:hypothetical protein
MNGDAPPRPAADARLAELWRLGEELLAARLAADDCVAQAAAVIDQMHASRAPARARRAAEAGARSLLAEMRREHRQIAAALDGVLAAMGGGQDVVSLTPVRNARARAR